MTGARRSYRDDPRLLDRVFGLLEGCFPGVGEHARKIVVPGERWEDRSTPFVDEADGELVAHAGLLELPAVLDGEERLLGGVHAVCVRADRRGEGRCRRLMEAILEHCEGRYDALELHTDEPAIYTRYGFRVIEEHAFEIDAPSARRAGPPDGAGLEPVDLRDPRCQAGLARALHRRIPVSRVAGSVREACIALFNLVGLGEGGLFGAAGPNAPGEAGGGAGRPIEGLFRLGGTGQSARSEAHVALRLAGETLTLYDVISERPVSLEEILECVRASAGPARGHRGIGTVRTFFHPEAFGVAGRPLPARIKGDLLMVRGPFPPEGRPFMMPLTTHH